MQGLRSSADAAEKRLSGWGMGAAVEAIAAFARGPMRCVRFANHQLLVDTEPGELRTYCTFCGKLRPHMSKPVQILTSTAIISVI